MPTRRSGMASAVFCRDQEVGDDRDSDSTASVTPVLVTTSSMVIGRETPVCCWSGYCVT